MSWKKAEVNWMVVIGVIIVMIVVFIISKILILKIFPSAEYAVDPFPSEICSLSGKTRTTYISELPDIESEKASKVLNEYKKCFKSPFPESDLYSVVKKIVEYEKTRGNFNVAKDAVQYYLDSYPTEKNSGEMKQLLAELEREYKTSPQYLYVQAEQYEKTDWKKAKNGYETAYNSWVASGMSGEDGKKAGERFVTIESERIEASKVVSLTKNVASGVYTYNLNFGDNSLTGYTYVITNVPSAGTNAYSLKVMRGGDDLAGGTEIYLEANKKTARALINQVIAYCSSRGCQTESIYYSGTMLNLPFPEKEIA